MCVVFVFCQICQCISVEYNAGMKTYSTTISTLRRFLLVSSIFFFVAQTAFAGDTVTMSPDATASSATALSASVSPSSLPEIKTGVALGVAVDEIVKKMDGVRPEDYCMALDQTLLDIASDTRETLAWNVDSYEKNTKLKAIGAEDTKAMYASLQTAYSEVTQAIQTAIDTKKGSSARAAALLRSAYLELMSEYQGGTPNMDRVAQLKNTLASSTTCVANDDTVLASTVATAIGGKVSESDIVIVTREDLDGASTTPVSSGSVSSKTELTGYIKSVLSKNETVTAVATGPSKTDVTIRQKARLFGFIPVHIKARTSVATDGRVGVSYPWYKFLIRVPEKMTSEMVLEKLPKDILSAKTLSVGVQAKIVDVVVATELSGK